MNANATRITPHLPPLAMNLASPPATHLSARGHDSVSKVLLAEGDSKHLGLLTKLIEEAGFKVLIARDGREARKLLQSGPELVAAVFEVVIPHISGPDLVRFMKKEDRLKDIPVIMLTGSRSARFLYESFNAGATVLVPEPFSMNQLKHLIHMLVHSEDF